jgi:hypothetical protein
VDDVTATKEVLIECDEGGRFMGCPAHWSGGPNQTIFSARTDAHQAGWRHRGGRDWCPDHAGRKT